MIIIASDPSILSPTAARKKEPTSASGLSEVRRPDCAAFQRICRKVHGRRRAGLLRIMYGLNMTSIVSIFCGNRTTANAQMNESITLATKQGARRGRCLAHYFKVVCLPPRNPADAIQTISTGIIAIRSFGSRMWAPFYLSHLAWAYAELQQFTQARGCIDEALRRNGPYQGKVV